MCFKVLVVGSLGIGIDVGFEIVGVVYVDKSGDVDFIDFVVMLKLSICGVEGVDLCVDFSFC